MDDRILKEMNQVHKFNIISKKELKQMFIDIDAPIEIKLYFIELTDNYTYLKKENKRLTQ